VVANRQVVAGAQVVCAQQLLQLAEAVHLRTCLSLTAQAYTVTVGAGGAGATSATVSR
jgi:hypothetical protein